jgi:multidrug efflux pump subunit AcrA (membrane-fusion protein)
MSFIASIYRRLVTWYGARTVALVLGLIIALGIGAIVLSTSDAPTTTDTDTVETTVVSVAPVTDLAGTGGSATVLGTVSALREARLETESGGRVTSVNVKLGDAVRAGQTLATLENSRERALVLQAQGTYEAALAGASSGNASVVTAERAFDEARISAMNTYRSSFTTVDGVVRGTLDTFFSDPDGAIPGLLIDGRGQALALSNERVALGDVLETWSISALGSDADADLAAAEQNTKRVSALLATIASLYAEDNNVPANLTGQTAALAGARAQLDGALASISGARSGLNQAENALTQARISGQSGAASASDAQVKQALGSLRLAQANLEKTIIRSPITGTVQSLTLKEGTTVSAGAPAAIVSSEGALEILAYVTENDARSITIGAPVTIEGDITGVVTQLASAIDPTTKKIEMRVGIEGAAPSLTNGQSVRVSVAGMTPQNSDSESIILPIVALKMTPDGAVVFTVENDTLIAHPVTLGAIRNDAVVIESGIERTWKIVTDARGLRAGEKVSIK